MGDSKSVVPEVLRARELSRKLFRDLSEYEADWTLQSRTLDPVVRETGAKLLQEALLAASTLRDVIGREENDE